MAMLLGKEHDQPTYVVLIPKVERGVG